MKLACLELNYYVMFKEVKKLYRQALATVGPIRASGSVTPQDRMDGLNQTEQPVDLETTDLLV